ncbi:uncharacterized protein DUF4232 [Streptomyces sp. 840.1]|uniref:DUF4232 domain-containing protein n=1 Tax=Streptomyces sp. 840.1 TaxID=2485152 RepID=UPI000F468BC5|nr:DUF4232 domain-containing protein [Streptomyces sp. 840.1]ROQ67308.1 uncharacterized protein DUF4232 [Streptomyces sp. 840.1]
MRVKKISALALVVAAAGLSLTACGGSDGSSASADSSTSTSASSSTGGQDAGSGNASDSTEDESSASGPSSSSESKSKSNASTGSGSGKDTGLGTETSASAAMCRTDDLAFSTASAGVKNQLVVNLKNTGSGKCSMHGFPGVELVGPDGLGDTGPEAARTDAEASTVTIAPGEETRFLLRYIPATDGSGKTYTRLSVTPPNEKVSAIANLDGLTITVPSSAGSPDVFVDPIGYHTGSGK